MVCSSLQTVDWNFICISHRSHAFNVSLHLILLDLVGLAKIQIIKILTSNFLLYLTTFFPLESHILLSNLFWNILDPRPYLTAKVQVSHPRETTGKTTALHINLTHYQKLLHIVPVKVKFFQWLSEHIWWQYASDICDNRQMKLSKAWWILCTLK
jgi:hypothetical protein